MTFFQDAMDDLKESLIRAETEKKSWQPIPDILIEHLQYEIEKTKVSTGNYRTVNSVIRIEMYYCRNNLRDSEISCFASLALVSFTA